MTVERVLTGHDLFRSLNVDEAHRVSDFSSVKEYRAGDTVFKYNEPASHVYMLMTGSVDLLLPARPSEFNFVISKIEKGELFGLSPLLDSKRYTATAQCRERTELLSVEAMPLRELLLNNNLAGFNMMNQVARTYFARYISVLESLQGVISQISLIR